MSTTSRRTGRIAAALGLMLATAAESSAGWPRGRRSRAAVVTTTASNVRVGELTPAPMLGTFYPDPPPLNVRGNFEAGGGYSPLGLYGDSATTLKTAKDFKVFYEKRAGSDSASYTLDHTAASYVFDPQGRLRLYVKYDQIGTLADDIRTLLKERS